MSKRRHVVETEQECAEEYHFSLKDHTDVIDRENLIGCKTILDTLEHEVAWPLKHMQYFECFGGSLPVNRFIRFYGIKHSSKRSAVLSFAKKEQLFTSVVRSEFGFDPSYHIPRMIVKHKSIGEPSLIILSNVEKLFVPVPMSNTEVDNCKILAQSIRVIIEEKLPIWIVFCTATKAPFLFDIDVHFASHTMWSGIVYPSVELFTIIERMEMITVCIKRFSNNAEIFPWQEPCDLREFVEKHMSCCTFSEIKRYVTQVFNLKRKETIQQHSLTIESIASLIPSIDYYYRCLYRDGTSIVPYAALDENINTYLS